MRVKILLNDNNSDSLSGLIEEIGKNGPLDLDVNHIVLVKDNFSLTFERDILKQLNLAGTFSVDVLSFSRLLAKLQRQFPPEKFLSASSGVMLVAKLLLERGEDFGCYRTVAGMTGFAETVHELILSLKCCGVTPEQFARAGKGAERHLRAKVEDLAEMYFAYEKRLANRYVDAAGRLDLIARLARDNPYIAGSHVYLAGFDSYTDKDFLVVAEIARTSLGVTLSLTEGSGESRALRRFTEMCASLNLAPEVVRRPSSLKPCFRGICDSLFRYRAPMPLAGEGAVLSFANDIREETERIAATIRKEAISGRRYRRMAVVCQDLDGYRLELERAFQDYHIPFFLDDGVKLADHPAVQYLLQLLEIRQKGKSPQNQLMIALSKSCFSGFSREDAGAFENYCLKFGINYGKFCEEFRYENPLRETAERVRKSLSDTIARLLLPELGRGADFSEAVLDFLSAFGFSAALGDYAGRLEQIGENQLAAYTRQVEEKLTGILQQISEIFSEQYLTAENFIRILESGLTASKISLIPLTVDSVFVGSINDCQYLDADILFFAGANDALVPPRKKDLNLLSEEDLDVLEKNGISVSPRLDETNRQGKFHTLMALISPKEKLFVSYSRVGSDGRETAPSIVFTELKAMGIPVNGDEAVPAYSYLLGTLQHAEKRVAERLAVSSPQEERLLSSAYGLLKEWGRSARLERYFAAAPEKLTLASGAEQLFFPGAFCSATKLETYYTCPFKHYVLCGLGARSREEYGFTPMDSGTYLHKIVELYTEQCHTLCGDQAASDALVAKISDQLLSSNMYSHYRDSKLQALRMRGLTEEAKRVCYGISVQLRNSGYSVKGRELRFGNGGTFSALPVGRGIALTGVIDRLDVYGDFARVLDYKTGKIDNSLSEVYMGRKLQLYLYQQVAVKNGYRPGGAFYFPIHNEFTAGEDSEPDYRLIGSVLAESENLAAMDPAFTGGEESLVLPVKRSADGSVKSAGKSKLNLARASELAALSDYSEIMAGAAVESILSGDIRILPQEGACSYCDCASVCRRDPEEGGGRSVPGECNLKTFEEAVSLWKNGR